VSSLFWYLLVLFLLFNVGITLVYAARKHVRPSMLLNMQEQNAGVERTTNLLKKPNLDATLTAALVMIHLILGGFAAWFAYQTWPQAQANLWIPLGTVLTTVLVVLVIEYLLEGSIMRDSQTWMIRLTPLAEMVYFFFRPFAWLGGILLRSSSGEDNNLSVIEEDIKNWAESGQSEGSLEQEERQMIYSIFQFGDTLCREIMVPRIDVFALEASTPVKDAIPLVVASGHSRVPVYEEVIDNVVGLLYAKDMLGPSLEKQDDIAINHLLRDAYFIPEAKKVDELLKEMQARGVHIAVVVDEYGGMAGLVTLEDIVEEIVGEIRDEYDQSEELLYQPVSDDEMLFHGRIDIDEVNELMDTHLTRDVADTLGGYIYGQVGRVPFEGEKVILEGWELTVEKVIGRRIRLVRAVRQIHEQEHENGKSTTR
jgi:putative hemolysin